MRRRRTDEADRRGPDEGDGGGDLDGDGDGLDHAPGFRLSTPTPLSYLLDRWASDEERFRAYGQAGIADVIARLRSDLAEHLREAELHMISAEEAAARSGYSRSALRKMRERGELSDVGPGRYVSSELPKKAQKRRTGPRLAGDLADQAVLDRARARPS